MIHNGSVPFDKIDLDILAGSISGIRPFFWIYRNLGELHSDNRMVPRA